MDNGRLEQVIEIFDAALSLAARERDAYLQSSCSGDRELRAEVERLLLRHEQAGDFLESPVLPDANESAAGLAGRQIGPYKMLRELGSGGMGVVYLAVRTDDVYHKEVAVKLVWPGMQRAEIIRRFKRERQILGALEHPNIARLLDGGATEEGWPYVVMEYVDGQPITDYCTAQQVSIEDRLRLFRDVCAAVEYAHRKSIIHRDLKPSNIFVTKEGVVKLLDFGIAKLLTPEGRIEPATLTQTALNLMTPEYASPEQIRNEEITAASDVYSLGVLLYELLTGVRPYRIKSFLPHEISQAICEIEPEPPSHRIAELARLQPFSLYTDPKKLRRQLTGDLDNIVMKALEKDAVQRYPSAGQFSQDIWRYLVGEPVTARHLTIRYRASRFVRRYKALVAATGFVILTLSAGILFSLWQVRRTESLARQNQRLLYAAQISLAQQSLKEGNIRRAHELLEAQQSLSGENDLRGFEWGYLQRLTHQEAATLVNGGEVLAIALSPDGAVLAAANRDGAARLWDVSRGKLLATLQGQQAGIWSLAFSPDGRLLATGSSDNTVRLWNLATGQVVQALAGHSGTVRGIIFTADGQWMLTASEDRTIRKWNVFTGQIHSVIPAHESSINAIALAPDGKNFATGSSHSTAKLWDLSSGRELLQTTIAGEQIRALAFSPDGHRIALATTGEKVDLWDLKSNLTEAAFVAREISWAVAFSPNGQLLATGSFAHTATLWDVAGRREVLKLPGHLDRVYGVLFSPDGHLLMTGSKDGTVKVWDLQRSANSLTLQSAPAKGTVWASALSPDGKTIAIGSDEQYIRLWETDTWREIKTISCQCDKVRAIAFSPDGRHLASSGKDRIIRLWQLWEKESDQPVRLWATGHGDQIRSLAFSPDGKLLTSASEDHTIRVWEAASGKELQNLRAHTDKARAAAFSPDGQTLVTAADDGNINFWSVADWEKRFALSGQLAFAIAFSPDGRQLAIGGGDYTASLWDARTGQKIRSFVGHANRIWGLAFSPDGKRLATAGGDRTIRLWEVETGYELLSIELPEAVRSVLFTQDGNRLVVTGDDELVKVFEATKIK